MREGEPIDNAPVKRVVVSRRPTKTTSVPKSWDFAFVLVIVTLIAYIPALRGGFVWDDDAWTTKISRLLRDFSGLLSIWCKPTALQQYYPLTGTTFWLDYQLWGFWALPYHVENVLLHILAALLFWQLLRRLDVAGAWLAGAIFALHPVMVESAGWITERKNVLSLVLYLGALLAYGRFNSFWREDNNSNPSHSLSRWRAYWLALFLALGALLAKTTTFSLPAVILLICWWKRGRIRWRTDVLPTVPFFILAIGFCAVTAWLEKNHVGAQGSEFALPFPERCLLAGRALWFYVGKLLWPVNLSFVYPRWQFNARSMSQWLYPITAIGALFVLWLARRKIGRGPAAAAFFFVGTLFPVLGFMNVFGMRYSFVWDHWVYLSSLGLIALAGTLVARATEYFRTRAALHGFAAVILTVLMVLTWRHAEAYTDSETLWQDTLAKNPNAFLAHNQLGKARLEAKRLDEAIQHYQEALRIKPDSSDYHDNLGAALYLQRKPQEAIRQFEQALRIDPNDSVAHGNLGRALEMDGRLNEAIGHYEQALRISPDSPVLEFTLGRALSRGGRVKEAIRHCERALQLSPDYTEARNALTQLQAMQ